MTTQRWLIYGANGYTGELIAREAWQRGMDPVLAGRTEEKILPLARELDCEARLFSLDEPGKVARHLQDIALVLHCAGPFSSTGAPMVEACLLSQTHYLDITGEIEVFEYAYEQNDLARDAGIALCPGVGFDVLPTDCVAARLKAALPDADQLRLGFDSQSHLSPGTAKTALEGLALGGKIRRDGEIATVPLTYKVRAIDFGAGPKRAVTIPWGDIASAYRSTGIPNIETYMPVSTPVLTWLRCLRVVRPLLRWRLLQNPLQRRLGRIIRGPDSAHREQHPTHIWGEASNPAGDKRTARIRIGNAYDVTVAAALAMAQAVLRELPAGGSYTPSQIMGPDFVTQLPGSGELSIE